MSQALALSEEQIAKPNWNDGRGGEWKKYVNETLQKLWPSFTREQRCAIIDNAAEVADQIEDARLELSYHDRD